MSNRVLQCLSCVQTFETAAYMQAQNVNDTHANDPSQSVSTSEAAVLSPRDADIPTAEAPSEHSDSSAQACNSGEDGDPQGAAQVPTPASETTPPPPADTSDATFSQNCLPSPLDTPRARSGVSSSSETSPATPVSTIVSAPVPYPMPSLIINPSMAEAASDMECELKQGGDVLSEAAPPAADCHSAVPAGQSDRSLLGPASLQVDNASDIECGLKPDPHGSDVAEADTPAADCYTAVLPGQPDSLSAGSTGLQPDIAADMECVLNKGGDVAEAAAPAVHCHTAVPSGQPNSPPPAAASVQPDSITQSGKEEPDTCSEGPTEGQPDSAAQSSTDGEGVHPHAAGMGDPQPPVLVGEADAGKAHAAQPDPSSSGHLSPFTAANFSYSSIVPRHMPECLDGSGMEADASEAEDPCLLLQHPAQHTLTLVTSPGLTLGAGSFDFTDTGCAAAGISHSSTQLEAETAADDFPMHPAQEPPAPPPSAPVPAPVAPAPLAPVPAALSAAAGDLSAAAGDQRDSAHEGAASSADSGSGSQAQQSEIVDGWGAAAPAVDMTAAGASEMDDGWGEAAKAVDGPSLGISSQRAERSFEAKKKRCWKKKVKVSCTAQPPIAMAAVDPCRFCCMDRFPILLQACMYARYRRE